MATTNIINLSKLEGAKRIDAEYYKTEYYSLLKKLKSSNIIPIKDVAIPAKRKFNPKEDEFYDYIEISGVDLHTGEFTTSKITGKNAPYRAQWVVKKYDILVSTVRPIRNAVTIIWKEQNNLVASSGFCILRAQKVMPEYLYIYLKTDIMKNLLDRYTTATEYPAITWNDILNAPIYLASSTFQETLAEVLFSVFNLLECSKDFYSQAEALLIRELGISDFEPQYKKTYTAKLSDCFSSHRTDAEYFQPVYEEVFRKIEKKKLELRSLDSFILGIQKGVEPGRENYREKGKPFIRVSNLSVYGFTDRDQRYLSDELYEKLKETYEPKQGDFLLTKDANPGIAYVVKEGIEGIISSGILKLKIDESKINKEYLALCINSLIGKMQIERDVSGSVIIHWRPKEVKRLKIPVLSIEIQQRIASLIQQSYQARKKARELLEIAKKAVEIAIEKNEEEALDSINNLKL